MATSAGVIVTGAGQGLGRAFALDLARCGWHVGVVDVDADRAASVAAEIGQHGRAALPFACDVSDSEQVGALAREAARDLGPVVGLVNNAAIFSALEMGPFDKIDPAVWERVIRVNVTGVFFMCRAFVPHMRAEGYGKIVNISSATIFFRPKRTIRAYLLSGK